MTNTARQVFVRGALTFIYRLWFALLLLESHFISVIYFAERWEKSWGGYRWQKETLRMDLSFVFCL